MTNLVSQQWLWQRMESKQGLVIADARFQPGDPAYGQAAYRQGHIPGAVYVDIKRDLADPPGRHGGRSPLPHPDRLAETFGRLGIDRHTPVVVYDDDLRPEGARLWWILNYLGHDQVYILNGGLAGWLAAGYPITSEETKVSPRTFEYSLRHDWLADVQEVRDKLGAAGVTLLDSRDRAQYTGEAAPQDPIPGHIPGALHAFWKDGVRGDGTLRPAEEQRGRFAAIPHTDEVIVYCGSGLSACPNVLALLEAGYRKVKLYAGSWSDWISYPDHEVELRIR